MSEMRTGPGQIEHYRRERLQYDFGIDADWTNRVCDTARAAHDLQARLAQYERQCIPRTADMPEWAYQWRKADDGTTVYVGWDRPRKRDEGRDIPWLQTVPAPDLVPDEPGPVYRHIVDVE